MLPDSPPSPTDRLSLANSAVQSMYRADRASQNLGLEILEVAPGSVRLRLLVRPEMVNGHGLCHGGIIFSLADSAFAFACNSHGEPMVAAGATIEFLAPTPAGELLTALATEVSSRFSADAARACARPKGLLHESTKLCLRTLAQRRRTGHCDARRHHRRTHRHGFL
jgi:phenylacetic acid degradation protein PaaD